MTVTRRRAYPFGGAYRPPGFAAQSAPGEINKIEGIFLRILQTICWQTG
jgi:hypothetical protein